MKLWNSSVSQLRWWQNEYIIATSFCNLLRIWTVFFLQVLAKSAKVIPVMLMGKLVSRTQYKNYEYATALLISIGMTAFLLGSSEGKKGKTQKKNNSTVLCPWAVCCNWRGDKENQYSVTKTLLLFLPIGNTVTTISGVVLLVGYLIFDSFTANWQSALFKGTS